MGLRFLVRRYIIDVPCLVEAGGNIIEVCLVARLLASFPFHPERM